MHAKHLIHAFLTIDRFFSRYLTNHISHHHYTYFHRVVAYSSRVQHINMYAVLIKIFYKPIVSVRCAKILQRLLELSAW